MKKLILLAFLSGCISDSQPNTYPMKYYGHGVYAGSDIVVSTDTVTVLRNDSLVVCGLRSWKGFQTDSTFYKFKNGAYGGDTLQLSGNSLTITKMDLVGNQMRTRIITATR